MDLSIKLTSFGMKTTGTKKKTDTIKYLFFLKKEITKGGVEPPPLANGTSELPLFYFVVIKWRIGRDSNPRTLLHA